MPEEMNDLIKSILKWINDQGYPLEMEVAAAFQSNNFNVSSSDMYQDIHTGKYREIDVTALRWSDFERSQVVQVCWRVECKSSKDKPWIMFISSSPPDPFYPLSSLCTVNFRPKLIDIYNQPEFANRIRRLEILTPNLVSHGITEAFKDGADIPYTAVISAVKASIDRIKQVEEISKIKKVKGPSVFWGVAFPTVVIDGRLFACHLGKDH